MPHARRSSKSRRQAAFASDSQRTFSAKRNDVEERLSGFGQQPLSRHVIDLQPDAVGVLEQQRIVAWRPFVLARCANDVCTKRGHETMQFVHVGALAGTKAEMMQSDALLLERGTRMLGRGRRYPDRGTTADAIERRRGIDDRRQAEKRQQLAV